MPYKPIPNVPCAHCGEPFNQTRPTVIYCSRTCYHAASRRDLPPPNPSGLCWCGCGEKTARSTTTSKDGARVIGEFVRYKRGHCNRLSPVEFIAEDRGYHTPCWIWQKGNTRGGYGSKHNPETGRTCRAHRWYYEKLKGPIPRGLTLDHLCRQPSCVNPDHLEPVTTSENTRRANEARRRARQGW